MELLNRISRTICRTMYRTLFRIMYRTLFRIVYRTIELSTKYRIKSTMKLNV